MPEIHLPVFEGPLDLLLRLIEREDLDITAISLVAVADQFLKAIHDGRATDPDALAEFVAIGARLIYLKSRALLPRPPLEPQDDLEEDEVGRELVDLLQEYRRFLEVVGLLEERQQAGLRQYPRAVPARSATEPPGSSLGAVTAEQLWAIMMEMRSRKPAEPQGALTRDRIVPLAVRVDAFRALLRRSGSFSFRGAIAECRTRLDVVVAFLAILELMKRGECEAVQAAAWGDIQVVAVAVVMAPGAG